MTLFDWVTFGATALALGLLAWRWRAERARAERWETAAVVAERRLAEARQRLELLDSQVTALEAAQIDGVLMLDGLGKIMRLNAAAQEIFGSVARPGESLMTASRSAELDELVSDTRDRHGELEAQIGLAGVPFRVRIRAAEGDSVIVVLREMSELQRLGRARRDFIANISHELRTPLTSVRLLVESLLSGVARDPDEVRGLLEKINTEVNALEQMSQVSRALNLAGKRAQRMDTRVKGHRCAVQRFKAQAACNIRDLTDPFRPNRLKHPNRAHNRGAVSQS